MLDPFIFIVLVALLISVTLMEIGLYFAIFSPRFNYIAIYPDKLEIRDGIFRRRTLAKADIDNVSIIDWKKEPSLVHPFISKLYDMVLGNYYTGEIEIAGQRALALSISSKNLLIETKKGNFLLGPSDFERFIDHFKSLYKEIKGA